MKNAILLTDFEKQITRKNPDIHIKIDNFTILPDILRIAYKNGFNFLNANPDINDAKTLEYEVLTHFYCFYHGNAKPVLHFIYNDITGKNDIIYTCAGVAKTYPQYKNVIIYNIAEVIRVDS